MEYEYHLIFACDQNNRFRFPLRIFLQFLACKDTSQQTWFKLEFYEWILYLKKRVFIKCMQAS